MGSAALSGIRVLDLTQRIAGPYCTKLLADFGAEVLKVEPPGHGDASRRFGPFPDDRPDPEASGLFLYLNTNKKSITLDLETDTGRQIARRLAADTDVLVEDMAPGTLARYGLTREALAATNPGLVVVSITPFGQDGPWRDWQAEEVNIQAVCGLMQITGDPDREPLKNGGHQMLFNTGLNAFTATLIAIYARLLRGVGQHVDVSAYETATYMMEPPRIVQASVQGDFVNRVGNRGTLLPAKNGHVNFIRGGSGIATEVLADMTGNEDFRQERFRNAPLVGPLAAEISDEMEAMLLPWLLEHTKEDFYYQAQEAGQNFGYVASPADLIESPQLKARGFFVDVEHPVAGNLTYPGAPYRMSATPWQAGRAPLLGEHNEAVYVRRLGYASAEMADLRRAGVI